MGLPFVEELIYGRQKRPSTRDFASIYVWYDYFSVPQGHTELARRNRERAVSCIPPLRYDRGGRKPHVDL